MPLIPALGKQRQVDLCEFKASLVYQVSSRIARTVTQRNHVDKAKRKERKKKSILAAGVMFAVLWGKPHGATVAHLTPYKKVTCSNIAVTIKEF